MTKGVWLAASLFVFGLLGGCADEKEVGAEGGSCFANDTCNPGLVCLSGLCVRLPDGSCFVCRDGGPCPDAPGCTACADGGSCPACPDAPLSPDKSLSKDVSLLPEAAAKDLQADKPGQQPDLFSPDLFSPDVISPDLLSPDLPPDLPLPTYQIIITEIMSNPASVADSVGEWFEIYNAGSTTVDLDGWTIKDSGTDSHTITASAGTIVSIAPGKYLVLGISDDPSVNGQVDVGYKYAQLFLDDVSDEIMLYDKSNNLVDKVEYNPTAGWPLSSGSSMSLKSLTLDNNQPWNWCLESFPWTSSGVGDRGSPGIAAACITP